MSAKIPLRTGRPQRIDELMRTVSNPLHALRARLDERATLLRKVQDIIQPRLAPQVLSAGLDEAVLTLGVASAAWASRLRYVAPRLREQLNEQHGLNVTRVRVAVVLSHATRNSSQA